MRDSRNLDLQYKSNSRLKHLNIGIPPKFWKTDVKKNQTISETTSGHCP